MKHRIVWCINNLDNQLHDHNECDLKLVEVWSWFMTTFVVNKLKIKVYANVIHCWSECSHECTYELCFWLQMHLGTRVRHHLRGFPEDAQMPVFLQMHGRVNRVQTVQACIVSKNHSPNSLEMPTFNEKPLKGPLTLFSSNTWWM